MATFRTLRPVTFPAGTVLALDDQQAATRKHVFYDMEPGVYVARADITFKTGEIVGLMMPPTKGDSGLEPIDVLETHIPDDKNTHDDDDVADGNPDETPRPEPAIGAAPAEGGKPGKKAKA